MYRLSEEEQKILLAHLAQARQRAGLPGTMPRCPVCNGAEWQVLGVGILSLANEPVSPSAPTNVPLGGQVSPLIQVCCMTCYHVMQFAWLAILRKAGGGVSK